MQIENKVYILAKESNGKYLYLCDEDGVHRLGNDIRYALKAKNKVTAQYLRDEFEQDVCIEHDYKSYNSDLDILPLKITYEW